MTDHTSPEVVVGVDGSPAAARALLWAAQEARLRGVPLRVIHAWQLPLADAAGQSGTELVTTIVFEEARKVLDLAVASIDAAHLPEPVHGTLVRAPAAKALLDATGEEDLLVVGARSHGGLAGIVLGSVSDQVVRHSHCPVVVVPAKD